jgi:NAD(P)-dependent dehydrogenase (short-subunit alcohol dehydrogenase family)
MNVTGAAAEEDYMGFPRKEQQQTVLACVCDVRKPEQCQNVMTFFAEQNRATTTHRSSSSTPTAAALDILVNGAAGNFLAAAENLSPKGFQTVMAIDALGTFNMTTAAFPYLKKRSSEAVSLNHHHTAGGVCAGAGAVVCRYLWLLL